MGWGRDEISSLPFFLKKGADNSWALDYYKDTNQAKQAKQAKKAKKMKAIQYYEVFETVQEAQECFLAMAIQEGFLGGRVLETVNGWASQTFLDCPEHLNFEDILPGGERVVLIPDTQLPTAGVNSSHTRLPWTQPIVTQPVQPVTQHIQLAVQLNPNQIRIKSAEQHWLRLQKEAHQAWVDFRAGLGTWEVYSEKHKKSHEAHEAYNNLKKNTRQKK